MSSAWRHGSGIVWLAAIGAAQQPAVVPWLADLERPDGRFDAVRQIVEAGAAALPALHRELAVARPELAPWLLFACSGLAGDVESLREPIRRHLGGKDLAAALAARAAMVALDGRGRTLVADYAANSVLEIAPDGTSTVLVQEPMAMAASRLADGHLLVAGYGRSRVVEFDAAGQEVWQCGDLSHPSDAERLPDGHTLIADSGNKRVVEVDRTGQIVWSHGDDVHPIDADRLGNGNTLIASYKSSGVVEVDRAGKVVWQWRCDNARDADRLPDGTTLITCTDERRVVLVDRDAKVVREWKVPFAANDAELLPNGHLLVAGEKQVVEWDREGRVVWEQALQFAGRVQRLGARVDARAAR